MSKDVNIFFCGDFCSKPSTTLITVSEELKSLIKSSDLSVCNFEVPLKPEEVDKDDNYFYQNDDSPAFLENLGFNVFSFSNNHVFDYGENGYHKTINAFTNKPFGSGTYDEAYTVKIIETKGKKIGFMALTYAARFGVFNDVNNRSDLGSAWINDLIVNHKIIEAKRIVDFLIILPHDGIEYIDVPIPETIARYRDFIDYGADAVIGSHPHCPQGWEEYKGKPIFYSLGNFFFNSKETPDYRAWNRPHWYEGLCVIIKFSSTYISYEVINTLNINNLKLEINASEEVKKHNELICNYLIDKNKYNSYLIKELSKLTYEKELAIIDTSFHKNNLILSSKHLFKSIIKTVFGRNLTYDRRLSNLLKNDTRRNALIRTLN